MTPAQWERVLRAGADRARKSAATTLSMAASSSLAVTLDAMADEAKQISEETQ